MSLEILETIAHALLYFDSVASVLVLLVTAVALGGWILKTLLRAALKLLRMIPIE